MTKRPNILIFNPDQMRADALHHLGNNAAITPNLDEFAQNDAVSFRNAYCQNPLCAPSRCSFLTGLYPHVFGHRNLTHMIHEHETTLFRELKEAGYYVWLNDRNDFLPAQEAGYYDKHVDYVFMNDNIFITPRMKTSNPRGEYGDKDYYSHYRGKIMIPEGTEYKSIDDTTIDAAIKFITHRDNVNNKPFCMFIGLFYPHPAYRVEDPYFSAIDRSKLPPRISDVKSNENTPSMLKTIRKEQMMNDYSEDDWNELRACYLGMCMKVDLQFGLICQALKDAGLYDDTDIYFFSDHGDFTGDYGITEKCQNTFEDCLVRVPFMIKPHKEIGVDPGISDSIVELVDFYATTMDLCSVKPNHTHFGRSLRNVLGDRTKEVREFASCEGGRLAEETHCSEVPAGLPDLSYEYRPKMIAQMNSISHTKASMLRTKNFKYVKRLYEKDELYDLDKDSNEINNLIDDEEYQIIINKMRDKMLIWYQETCDIVPFKQDSRFDFIGMWNNIKDRINMTDKEVAEIDRRIDNGTMSGTEFQCIFAEFRSSLEK